MSVLQRSANFSPGLHLFSLCLIICISAKDRSSLPHGFSFVGQVAQIKDQMRKQLEANLRQSMTEEARKKALKEAEKKAADQLNAIKEEAGSTEEEKMQAEMALQASKEEIEHLSEKISQEQAEQEELEKKIRAMESKVLVGGENLLEKHDALEAEAKEAEARLAAQREEEEAANARIREVYAPRIYPRTALYAEVPAKASFVLGEPGPVHSCLGWQHG